MTAKADLAYAAGIIDGEGCIFIGRTWHKRDKRLTHVLQVKVSMIDREALLWLRQNFGYRRKVLIMENRQTRGWNNVYTWHLTGAGAEKFLRKILPYLKVKRQQAKVALRFRELLSLPGIKLAAKNLARREQLCAELKALKKSKKVRSA